MINRRFSHFTCTHHRVRFIMAVTTLLLAILVVWGDMMLRPVLNRALSYQSRLIATGIIADCTYNVINQEGIAYNDLVTVTTLENNEVSSITTNVAAVNAIKSRIVNTITKELNNRSGQRYSIPLGTLTGSDYLMDRGPTVEFTVSPMGFADGKVTSRFTSAGINQTCHQLVLDIEVDITTLIPLHNANTVIHTNYILAETVIAGRVPQFYSNGTQSAAPPISFDTRQ